MTETAVQRVIIIANCIVNLALAFVAITGNALVSYGVWKTPSLRSPSILLLCGLASTDLFQCWFHRTTYNHSNKLRRVVFAVCESKINILYDIWYDRVVSVWRFVSYDDRNQH